MTYVRPGPPREAAMMIAVPPGHARPPPPKGTMAILFILREVPPGNARPLPPEGTMTILFAPREALREAKMGVIDLGSLLLLIRRVTAAATGPCGTDEEKDTFGLVIWKA